MLKAGFARVDITPPLGTTLAGYFEMRYADNILDPLLATAVAFDDGEKRAVIISIDNLGVVESMMNKYRAEIARVCKTKTEGVFLACTHTHTAPRMGVWNSDTVFEPEYADFLGKQLCTAARLAFLDLASATLSYTRGEVKGVSFIRRYRMRDGSARTNPGWQNPDIVAPIGNADETAQLLVVERENKPEIGIVNFQVHPDVIGGCGISADYPKFVRDTYEKLIDNSLCMFINGTQGDSNHFDLTLGEDKCRSGYDRARYMGRKIAMSVIANYELREKLEGDEISFAQKSVVVKYNRGTPEEIPEAKRIIDEYNRTYDAESISGIIGNPRWAVAKAGRIMAIKALGEERELPVSAICIGDAAFVGFPGEPFTEAGFIVKEKSRFALTIPACCANGFEGYYPTETAYDEEGYESSAARYEKGTAEKLANELANLINTFK